MVDPKYLPYFANTAAGVGGMVGAIGVTALLSPDTALTKIFEFPNVRGIQDRKTVSGLLQIFGIRDLALGLSVLAAWYHGCRHGDNTGYKTLGSILLLGCLVSITDGLVSRKVIGKGEWRHWGFVPVLAGLGLALTEWI